MKKLIIILFIAVLAVSFAAADPIKEKALLPLMPETVAQGSSFTGVARGYNALFSNPAGFARKGSLTLASATSWVYANPMALMDVADAASGDFNMKDMLNTLEPQFTENGFGVGASAGIGYVGRGLGLGATFTVDSFFKGDTFPLGIEGDITAESAFIGGYAFTIHPWGLDWHIGADVKFLSRVHAPLKTQDMSGILNGVLNAPEEGDPDYDEDANPIMDALNGVNALNGFGFGIDLGTMVEMGNFSVGLSMRDLFGTKLNYNLNELGGILDTYPNLPVDSDDPDFAGEYVIPMNVSLGFGWDPDPKFLKLFFDPMFHVEISDLFGTYYDDATFWTKFHAGTEIKVLRFIRLRAGIDQGYYTAGLGLKLLFLEAHAALFTKEMGNYAGDEPASGASVEVAFRF
jgi:hypothetical protein